MVPVEIQQQITKILESGLNEHEARARYPEVVRWFNEHVDLVSLIEASGVHLSPLSADCPHILVGDRCPCGGGPIYVRTQ